MLQANIGSKRFVEVWLSNAKGITLAESKLAKFHILDTYLNSLSIAQSAHMPKQLFYVDLVA